MNAEALLAHYERVSEAPDAVARLRRLIIDLAVRGKLAQQISTERAQLPLARTPQRSIGRRKQSAPQDLGVKPTEHPFEVPPHWAFVRLGGVLEMINGRAFKPTDWLPTGLPIVRIQNLNNTAAPFNFCDAKMVDERHLIRDGEFLISWSGTPGTSFGAFIWSRGLAALNQHIFRCVQIGESFAPEFLRLAINSQLDVLISQAQGGVGLQHVTKGTLEALPLPLPPLAEQCRVVAKVDELMELCDRLEEARAQREAMRDRLTSAAFARLNSPEPAESQDEEAPNASSFQSNVRFALDTLTALTTRRDQITQLRRTILNLAVRGSLTQREPDDVSAQALLPQIVAEAPSKLYAQSKLAIDPPYAIPSNWQWATLGQLIVSGPQNGLSPKPTTRPDAPRAITLTATTSGEFNPAHYKHVDVALPSDSDLWLRDGDLLFQRGNTREYVGMAAVFTGPPSSYLYPDLMIRVRVSSRVDLRFIHLASIAPPARKYFSDNATGAQLTMPKINQTTLLALPIPVPPKLEQHRIVAKVDELMSLCDQFEASLNHGENTRSHLLNALLHETLHPSHGNVVDFDAARKRLLEKRQAIGCRIVERLSRTKGFGRTRAVKPFYWAEAHCGIALGGRWGRGNFGPYDQWIMSFESDAAGADWFSCIEHSTSDGNSWIEYKPGSQLTAKAKMAAQVLDKQAAEFERVLTLLAGLDTDKTEIVTTLFAAWNDLLIEGKPVSDSIVITEMRQHWHPSKGRFTPAQLQPWLDWLRQNDLVPKGIGPCTRHQAELL